MFKVYLDAVRVNANKSQEEWAKELGVNKQTVVNWESGKSQPKLEHVRQMSEMSGIPIDYIFLRSNPTKWLE